MSWLSDFFNPSTTTKSTSTFALDPDSQRFVDQMRTQAGTAAGVAQGSGPFFTGPQTKSIGQQVSPFMNPFMSGVIGATRSEFDNLRDRAQMTTDQAATQAGAFGGTRHGVAEGVRMGELDRSQMSLIANLLQGGYQNALSTGLQYAEHQRQLREQQMREPLFRQQMAQQFLRGGMGPVGYTQTGTQSSHTPFNIQQVAGLAQVGAGIYGNLKGGGGGSFGGGGGSFGGGGQMEGGFGYPVPQQGGLFG